MAKSILHTPCRFNMAMPHPCMSGTRNPSPSRYPSLSLSIVAPDDICGLPEPGSSKWLSKAFSPAPMPRNTDETVKPATFPQRTCAFLFDKDSVSARIPGTAPVTVNVLALTGAEGRVSRPALLPIAPRGPWKRGGNNAPTPPVDDTESTLPFAGLPSYPPR